jgi:hypothetical protein
MEEKVFLGKTTVVDTQYGQIVKIAFGPNDFEVLNQQKNDKGWINLELKDKRDGGKYLQVQGNYQGNKPSGPVTAIAQEEDDMPF